MKTISHRIIEMLFMWTLVAGYVFGQETSENKSAPNAFGLKTSGFFDSYYSVNFNRPGNETNQLRNFDFHSNQVSINLAKLSFQKDASPVGFKVDLFFGPTADAVNSLDSGGTLRYIEQVYGTVVVPVSRGLTIDVGKFVTHLGAEVIETNANWNYSRSLLFAWAIPYFHTGIRASYPVSDQVTLMGMLANGWNGFDDNNKAKTLGAQISYAPTKRLTLIQNWVGGAEQDNNSKNRRNVFDFVANFQATDQLAFIVNGDYGTEKVTSGHAVWMGIAGMTRYAFNDKTAMIVRGEIFKDRDGNQTGVPQTLKEITLTGEWRAQKQFLVRGEWRSDYSNSKVFDSKNSGFKSSQSTFLIGAIFEF